MNFFKYQSLGNDFIIIDGEKPSIEVARQLCNRRFGIGADGVLLLTHKDIPEAEIINSDGSPGEMCLNGVRCLAQHLITEHEHPDTFKIRMCNKIITCTREGHEIRCLFETAQYINAKIVNGYTGHVVLAPNPHFIIFKKVTQTWLKDNGHLLEQHPSFSNKTNVEFVWQNKPQEYNSLIYERGCGLTLSCGSGAASILSTLFRLGKVKPREKININMPGGTLTCWVDGKHSVLQGPANLVFKAYVDVAIKTKSTSALHLTWN